MDDKKLKNIRMITLALAIAILPPIWAVLAPYIGISVGAVALISAGIFVANGNKWSDSLKIIIGFLLGDLWAVIALWAMDMLQIHPDIELYLILFVLGFLAVIIGESHPKYIYTPSLLAGWAIGLTIMAPLGFSEIGSLPFEIAAAMFAGVFYVGIGVDWFQKLLIKLLSKE